MWRSEIRICDCGQSFTPKREKQRHCSAKCGTRARVTQHRTRYRQLSLTALPEKPLQAPQTQRGGLSDGPTMVWPEPLRAEGSPLPIINGRINGIFDTQAELDAYQRDFAASSPPEIETYPDAYPKLPACLDRRKKQERLA